MRNSCYLSLGTTKLNLQRSLQPDDEVTVGGKDVSNMYSRLHI